MGRGQSTLRGSGLGEIREPLRRVTAIAEEGRLRIDYEQRFKNEGRLDRELEVLLSMPAMAMVTAPGISVHGDPYSFSSSSSSSSSPPPFHPVRHCTIEGRRNLSIRSRYLLDDPRSPEGEGVLRVPLLVRLPKRRSDFIDRLSLSLDLGSPPPLLLSLNHPVEFLRRGRRTRVSWTAIDHAPHADLLLLAARPAPSTGLLLSLPHGAKARIRRHLAIIPPGLLPPPAPFRAPSKTLVFLLDVTGSMRGNRLFEVERAVGTIIDGLGPSDRFNLISFADGTQSAFHGVQPATSGARARARSFLKECKGDGACNLSEALLVALDELAPPPPTDRVAICLITDGRPTMGQTDPAGVLRNVRAFAHDRIQIHAACLGYGADLLLAEALAKSTGGQAASFPTARGLADFFVASVALPDETLELRDAAGTRIDCSLVPPALAPSSTAARILALTSQDPLPATPLHLEWHRGDGRPLLRSLPLSRPSTGLLRRLDQAWASLLRLHLGLTLAPRIVALRQADDTVKTLEGFSRANRLLLAGCFGVEAARGTAGLALALTEALGPRAVEHFRWLRRFEKEGLWIPVHASRPLAFPMGGPAMVFSKGRFEDVRLGPKAAPDRRIRVDSQEEEELIRGMPWLREARMLGSELLVYREEGKETLLFDR